MGETTDQLEKSISRARSELRRNVDELERKASVTFSWKTQYDARPFTVLGLAFGGGMILSRIFLGSRRCKP